VDSLLNWSYPIFFLAAKFSFHKLLFKAFSCKDFLDPDDTPPPLAVPVFFGNAISGGDEGASEDGIFC